VRVHVESTLKQIIQERRFGRRRVVKFLHEAAKFLSNRVFFHDGASTQFGIRDAACFLFRIELEVLADNTPSAACQYMTYYVMQSESESTLPMPASALYAMLRECKI